MRLWGTEVRAVLECSAVDAIDSVDQVLRTDSVTVTYSWDSPGVQLSPGFRCCESYVPMPQVWFHLGTPQTLSSPGRWSLVQTQSSTMAPMLTVTGIYILVVSYNEVCSVFLDTSCRDSSFLMTTWCVLPLISPSQERKESLHIWISLFVSLPKDILIYHFVMIRMYVSCIFPTKILLGFVCMFFRNSTR